LTYLKFSTNSSSLSTEGTILSAIEFAQGITMAGEIIRMGDSTSHGGIVIEGSLLDICMGKPIAYVGHKVQCPKCKGIFPIVEGAPTTTFYGKGVALAGMHTACGAVLIASQFTDVVECGSGSSAAKTSQRAAASPAAPERLDRGDGAPVTAPPESSEISFDDKFILINAETSAPMAHTEYAIRRESGELEYGTTDANGHTHLLSATADAEVIEIYV
jgi:uncharacterized Zn-binding protein involved in type VI secretion